MHIAGDGTFAIIWISDNLLIYDDGKAELETGLDMAGQWILNRDHLILKNGQEHQFKIVEVGRNLALLEDILRANQYRVYVKIEDPLTGRIQQRSSN